MSLLTKETLMELNNRMLGLGAPTEIDNVGYNKIDYVRMYSISSTVAELTDFDAYLISTALIKYTNTQLTHMSGDIKETANYYQNLVKGVKVVDFSYKYIKLSWNFNKNVSNFIKTQMDKDCFKWTKPNGEWIFSVQWESLDQLIKVFQDNGFSTKAIQYTQENLDKLLSAKSEMDGDPENSDSEDNDTSSSVKVTVKRLETTIDTLTIEVSYNKELIEAFRSVPYMFFNKNDKTWECYIEYSSVLYNALKSLNINLDLTDLQPWANLVEDWKTTYDLVDWTKCPLKFKPYDFQIEDAKRLLSQKVMLNANDMGCGKTFEQVLIGESLPMKKLVICPPTLRINWRKEIQHVNPNANVHTIYSSDSFKVVDGWNIIGYNSLDKFQKELEAENFQVIMIDEAHYIQAVSNSGTPESKRAYAVLRLAATANYVYPITGTPKTNRNKNLFNILRVIRHPLSRGKWAFSNYGKEYCDGKFNSYGWDYNGNSNDEELNNQLTPFMIRHLKSEVLPHLKKQRIVTPVEVDLREYRVEIAEYLNNRTNKNAEDLARLMRARKILATQKVGESIDFARTLTLEDKKVVIVTCFTEVVSAVENAFKGNVVKLIGGMSDAAKDKAITEFQTGTAQVMIMNIVAGGVGVTLTKSYNMIINDFDWTPGNLTQAEDRICRSGQTEEYCNIYYLYASGADMDEVFAGTLTSKFDTINNVVDGGTGDSINYIDLITEALEKSTGTTKVRRMIKQDTAQNTGNSQSIDLKSKTLEELITLAKNLGVTCKVYENEAIYRMRLVMGIKKHMAG